MDVTYLDYAATTPIDQRVADEMIKHMTADGVFANPASRSHMYGWQAEAAVEKARKQVAVSLGVDTREIVWTSGATEANNLAIKGVVEAILHDRSPGVSSNSKSALHIVTTLVEHKAVLDVVDYLEQRHGVSVTRVKPESDGSVSVASIASAIQDNTCLVSVMHANNETGAINDISAIADEVKKAGAVFHVDAAQTIGKLPIDLSACDVDLLSMSAHKFYGPKGVGALFVRKRSGLTLDSQIHGGGHERGMRSGTLATHQIVGLGTALEIAVAELEQELDRLRILKRAFWAELSKNPSISVNGSVEAGMPNIVNLVFDGLDGQVLLSALPNLAISSGSACTSVSVDPSHVLLAMGVPEVRALSSLRVSFGRFTSEADVIAAARKISDVVNKML